MSNTTLNNAIYIERSIFSFRAFVSASLKAANLTRLFVFTMFVMFAEQTLSYAETTEYRKCISEHEDNRSWAICGDQEISRQEFLMAGAWKRVSEDIKEYQSQTEDGDFFKSLANEQKNWINYKDSSCQYYYSWSLGRESAVLTYPSCKAHVIADRVETLHGIARDIEDRTQR
jgi:uncharacterized protein YecT (DUF1311 family)